MNLKNIFTKKNQGAFLFGAILFAVISGWSFVIDSNISEFTMFAILSLISLTLFTITAKRLPKE